MKVVWIGASPHIPTGFGRTSKHMTIELRRRGYDVAVVDLQRFMPPSKDAELDAIVYPGSRYENWIRAIREYGADAVVILGSVWAEPMRSFGQVMREKFPDVKYIVYAPYEYITASHALFGAFIGAHAVASPSRYGQKLFAMHVGQEFSYYVPHGVDTGTFRPLETVKGRMPGFTYLMVARNNLRKEIASVIAAFALLPSSIKKQSFLMLYTTLQEVTPSAHGLVLGWDVRQLGLKYAVDDRIVIFHEAAGADWGVPDTVMNTIYNMADAYLAISTGEGFCYPAVEAMAAGRPVIASRNTALLELCEDGEYCLMVKTVGSFIESLELFAYTPTDIYDLSVKMEQMFSDASLRSELASKAVERARQFSWDRAGDAMEKVLDDVQTRSRRIETFVHRALADDFSLNPEFTKYAERARKAGL